MSKTPSLTGARESNAGDDFHIVWAARRAVQLLNPQSGLKKVFVEKLSTEDESLTLGDHDLFLGVDISEYFGGDTFASAGRVDVSQLKYSPRRPSRAWTASRLIQINRGASVIRRLAEIYQGFTQLQNWLRQGAGLVADAIPEKSAQKIFRTADQILRAGRTFEEKN